MLSNFGKCVTGAVAVLNAHHAPIVTAQETPPPAAAPEYLCLKKVYGPYEGLAIACYSNPGCDFVEKLGAESLPDYDTANVAAALGREKIEGIVTTSDAIMKEIKGYGYTCKKVD